MLASTKRVTPSATTYLVPSNSSHHYVTHWTEPGGEQKFKVVGKDGLAIGARSPSPGILRYDGERPQLKILSRCLKFLASSREPTPQEVLAILSPLAATVPTKRTRNPCARIGWREIYQAIQGGRA